VKTSTMNELFLALERAKSEANRDREMQDLTGVDCDAEGNPHDPYQALEEMLTQALREVKTLRLHAHVWNDEDLCSVCGADGRA
jgi:hypothetical protein